MLMNFFNKSEFLMNGINVFDKMDTEFLLKLDELREIVGKPMIITSSFRTKEYNKLKGGVKNSQHLFGNAVDIYCDNGTFRAKIVKHALSLGLSVGVSKSFVHVDNRGGEQVVFSYGS